MTFPAVPLLHHGSINGMELVYIILVWSITGSGNHFCSDIQVWDMRARPAISWGDAQARTAQWHRGCWKRWVVNRPLLLRGPLRERNVIFLSVLYPGNIPILNLSRPLGRSKKIGPSPRHELEFLVRHTLQHAAWPCKHVLGCGSVGFKAMTDIDEPLVSSFFGIYRVWFVMIASHGKIGGNEWFFSNYPISWSTSYYSKQNSILVSIDPNRGVHWGKM